MGLLFLLLVFANTLLQPMRRSLRKRGFFVLSLAVSTVFTYTVTRLFPLTPCLRQVPNAINTVVVMAFLWALYICTVALKRCFTLGEMCVLSQATAVLVFDSLCMMMSEGVPSFLKMDNHVDPVTVLLHAVTLGMMLIGMAAYPLLWRSRHLAQKPYWRSNPSAQALSSIHRKRIIISFAVYVLTVAFVTLVIAPVCKSIMDEDPFTWTLSFVFLSPQRLLLCVYWALAISATVIVWVLVLDFSSPDTSQQTSPPSIFNGVQGKTLTSSLNKKRKLFHALAVVMFVPGVLMEPAFLQLAFGVALSVFLYLEYLRYFAIWPYGKSIHLFLTEFIDSRDLGPVILSHIYLLLGCAAPVWLNR
ncbi:hypothetical protein K492DRAFT_58174 [Lichtheimia hyalospora FSU 10163]|nr:hypothetical protein K492DRAFT_58174 [Lichtheimia hyalospora FSU 10163]